MFSPPAVVGDLLFVGSCNGVLHAVDHRTGEPRWTYSAAADGGHPEFHGLFLVHDDLVVVGTDDRRPDGMGHVYAFNHQTLELVWKYHAGQGVMTDILQDTGTVYLVTLRDELVALDLFTGAVRWTFASGGDNSGFFRNSTPAIAGDRVIFGGLNGTVYALDAQSGRPLWTRELGARISTPVVVVRGDAYMGDASGRVHRLDGETGESRGELRVDGDLNLRLTHVRGSLLLFANEAGSVTLKSLPLSLDGVRWTARAPESGWSSYSSAHIARDWVVVGRSDGRFEALRLTDGAAEWDGQVDGEIAGVGGDDTGLYLGTTKGIVYRYVLPSTVAHR